MNQGYIHDHNKKHELFPLIKNSIEKALKILKQNEETANEVIDKIHELREVVIMDRNPSIKDLNIYKELEKIEQALRSITK